ncbi:MAG: hypothetical protein ABI968_00085 [Acidobacteriota bacterium]
MSKRRWWKPLGPLALIAIVAWPAVGCGNAETRSSPEKRQSPLPRPTPARRPGVTPIPRLPE